MAAEAGTQFAVTCKTQLVAAFAEMKIGHCSDETNALLTPRDLVIRSRAVRPKLSFRNQRSITRFDYSLRRSHRHEIVVVEHVGCANRHHLDETKNQTARRCEFYQWN